MKRRELVDCDMNTGKEENKVINIISRSIANTVYLFHVIPASICMFAIKSGSC
jgi:hypothetical protein